MQAIERAVIDLPNLVPDLARTLVETCCTTILDERGIDCQGLGFKDLLKNTYSAIQLVPDAKLDQPDTQEALRQLVNNLDSVIQSITNLRMLEGMASHGKEAHFASLETAQVEFIARTSDAIISFLYRVHLNYPYRLPNPPLQYTDSPVFNNYIDDSNDLVQILDLEYRPSEVLFVVDNAAYLDYLSGFVPEVVSEYDQPEIASERAVTS